MYTQECFLRSPGAHDVRMLSRLGYKSIDKSNKRYQIKKYLYIKEGFWKYTDNETDLYFAIDCCDDRKLFSAIASIDDNSIAEQWLTDGKHWIWIKCSDYNAINDLAKINKLESLFNKNYHKATPEEIILKGNKTRVQLIQMGSIGEINKLKFILEKEDLVRSGGKILDSNGEEYTLSKTWLGVKLEKVRKSSKWSGRELKEVENMCENLKCDNAEISYSLEGKKMVSCRLKSHNPKIEGKNKGIYIIPKNCPHCLSKHRDWKESSSSKFIPYQDLGPAWYGFKHFNKK